MKIGFIISWVWTTVFAAGLIGWIMSGSVERAMLMTCLTSVGIAGLFLCRPSKWGRS